MSRRFPKGTIEFLLAHGGPAALAARRRANSTIIVAYHDIVPDESPPIGECSLHLSVSQFRKQLDYLRKTHDVVDLDSIRDASEPRSRPRAAITFDDAYRGALLLGLPEVAARGLPATVFVAPGILGHGGCWWDVLASPDGSGLNPLVRDQAIDILRGDNSAVLGWARSQGLTLSALPSFAGIATEHELQVASRTPGIRLAPHTWSHCNLAHLAESANDAELGKPLAWLRQRFERVLPWLAYPYGLYGPETASAARAAGYEAALRIEGGWIHGSYHSNFVLPRFNANSGLTADGFVLRASGLITP